MHIYFIDEELSIGRNYLLPIDNSSRVIEFSIENIINSIA